MRSEVAFMQAPVNLDLFFLLPVFEAYLMLETECEYWGKPSLRPLGFSA